MIYDHAPVPGPEHYDWRCMVCNEPVRDHVNALKRALYRWRNRHGR